MTGLVLLVLAVAAAAGFGLYRRRTDGSFASAPAVGAAWSSVSAAVPDAALGERATLVQFSSAFCAPCRTTRVVLADVAGKVDGVAHVEIDAEQHLDLVRALDVRRTPTTLVLDRHGHELTRAAGAPRREQVLAALPALQES
ncbi:TlpA family protein disulfide reductase [Nocardioides nitrophenolicus]|uniref:TlpA family protein disulfide reductase n=1 Tax=Nocardioides nitrophenolicus TaxID=60489 RepID=UPI0027DCDD85|nr:thioredoxin family protein [Nocardioides nitrophenolicus]MBM7516540.1 thiol-disulfide isomerase/thioredoxin [Nocardioides nitrophenolicus]